MANIFGSPFRGWVTKQIQTRQRSLGYSDYGVDDLKYQNAKTPWIRLASAVDVTGDSNAQVVRSLLKSGISEEDFKQDIAAKNFILQGGVVGIGENNELKTYQGLNSTNEYYKGAYGWGGIDERGYVPLPGILDASLIYKSDGAFAQATVNMKCFSRSQLALMDILYMRPGFNLLLEFGWSTYLDNEGKLQTYDTFISNALDFTLNKNGITAEDFKNKDGTRQSNILGLIEKERISRAGNYEAIFGSITNFNWSFNKDDGSYNCQTKIIGHGNIIESLRINVNQPLEKTPNAVSGVLVNKDKTPGLTSLNATVAASVASFASTVDAATKPLQSNIKINLYMDYINKIYSGFNKAGSKVLNSKSNKKLGINDPCKFGVQDYVIESFKCVRNAERKDLTIKGGIVGFTGMQTDGESKNTPQVYIKFSVILAIVQKHFLLYDDEDNPYFYFDFDFFNLDEDENYITNIPGQFSADPTCCFTVYQNHNLPKAGFAIPDTTLNKIFSSAAPKFLSDKGHVAKMSDMFINIEFIGTIFKNKDLVDKNTGAMTLLAFLQAILSGVNSSRGGLNNFEVRTDLVDNTVKILDNSPARWKTNEPPTSEDTELCVFNTFGVLNKLEGSIVKSIDIQSKIDQDMMTIIAASTGNRSNGFNANGTGLAKWNQGLGDRIFPNPGDSTDKDKKEESKIKELWSKTLDAEGEHNGLFVSILDGLRWIMEDIETLKSSNQTFQELLSGEMVNKNQINSPYFLPFNINLDFEGISGIRLYEHFDMDDNVLPYTYDKDALELQIKSCDHTVNGTEWVSKVSAIPKPTLPPQSEFVEANALGKDQKPNYAPFPTGEDGQPGGSGGAGGNLPRPPGEVPPADEKRRMIVTRVMDDGTQTLGIMTIYDEDEQTVLYRLATSELPWRGNRNSVSSIPVDMYRVKSHRSGKHGACYWVIGNAGGNYAKDKLFGNGYIRSAVLIHKSPKAPGWLEGCIGPGFKINTSRQPIQTGSQKGTGTKYKNPSLAESIQAMAKLNQTLYSVGSYRMEVKNLGDVANGSLPKTFDASVASVFQNAGLM
tara:strand:- start:863 stop:4030 length:3168 start_codon:yes stop_codon:yes gene_type:complete